MPRQYVLNLGSEESNTLDENMWLDDDFFKTFAESLLHRWRDGDKVTHVHLVALAVAIRRVKQHDLNSGLLLEEKQLFQKVHPDGYLSDSLSKWLEKQQWFRTIQKKIRNFPSQRAEILNALTFCSK